jgi:hypothetical protein
MEYRKNPVLRYIRTNFGDKQEMSAMVGIQNHSSNNTGLPISISEFSITSITEALIWILLQETDSKMNLDNMLPMLMIRILPVF